MNRPEPDTYWFDVEGCDRVILTNTLMKCNRCAAWFPVRRFGLRRMGDGTVRNQTQCFGCRSRYSKEEAADLPEQGELWETP